MLNGSWYDVGNCPLLSLGRSNVMVSDGDGNNEIVIICDCLFGLSYEHGKSMGGYMTT